MPSSEEKTRPRNLRTVFFNLRAGTIPATIGNLTNLKQLYLFDNKLSGALCMSRHTNGPIEKRKSHAGPPLPETLRLLAPLAPTLENLDFGFNKLGGAITDDIAAFTKLTKLDLRDMNLEGESECMFSSTKQSRETTRMPTGLTYDTKQKVLSRTCAHFSQVPFPRRSAT